MPLWRARSWHRHRQHGHAAVGQAGQGLRDRELLDIVAACENDTSRQLRWLRTRIKQAAPQALSAAG